METVPVIPLGEFILRPLRPSDSGAWFGYLSDRRTTEHTSWPEVSAVMVAGIVDRLIGEYASRASLRWALARTSDDDLVGTCGYTRIDADKAAAELAYDLAPDYWGRGIMSAAVDAAVNWAFADGGLRRVETLVMVTNSPSIALLERCGFTRERLLPGHRIARGTPRDFWCYGKDISADRR
ncbi:MAG: GNAT family N-acetyltransferase [Thermoanaerobaculia bacterium]